MAVMRDGTSGRGSRIPRWLLVSAAAMLVTSPLLGVGFQGDQRTWMFIVMNETGGDPWEVVARTVRNIDYFLSAGNFRPLGRMLTDLEHVFYMETALASGVPPHLVHGFIRLAMVALLAVTAHRFLLALERSAALGDPGPGQPSLNRASGLAGALFPVVFAAVLVVVGLHPLVFFPFWSIAVVAAILAVPLIIASDRALGTRWAWDSRHRPRGEYLRSGLMVVLGASLAMTYDLLYVVPAVCLAVIAARGILARIGWRDLLRSVAAGRFIALCAGFVAVFLPTRLAIASRCQIMRCSPTAEVDVAGLSLQTGLYRAVTGLPATNWYAGRRRATDTELSVTGLLDLLGGSSTLLVVALLIATAGLAYRSSLKVRIDRTVHLRLGTASILVGLVLVGLPALMVSLTPTIQNTYPDAIDVPWRDTLMVQVGWSLAITGVLLLITSIGWTKLGRYSFHTTLTILLLILLSASIITYHTNYEAAQDHYSRPASVTDSLIFETLVNFNNSGQMEQVRCDILGSYRDVRDRGVVADLNILANSLYGQDFCGDHEFVGSTGIFADDDQSPYEREIDVFAASGVTDGCGYPWPEPREILFFCPESRVAARHMTVFLKRLATLDLIEREIVNTFEAQYGSVPGHPLTRADMTLFLPHLSDHLVPVTDPAGLFGDIGDQNLAGHAEAAYHEGILEGCATDPPLFCPDDPLTRAEVASLLVRTLDLEGSLADVE
jgi:hypothetical protein